MKPETAYARARDLERRLEKRLADLDRDEELIARSAGRLRAPRWSSPRACSTSCSAYRTDAAATSRATPPRPTAAPSTPSWPPNAPSAASRARCRITIRATTSSPAAPTATSIFIEVKGRIEGAEEFWVTRTEVLHGKNSATGSRLAMVSVSPRRPELRPGPLYRRSIP